MLLTLINNLKMQVFHSSKSIEQVLSKMRQQGTVGFVPTMGALHRGHLSLIQKAQKENDIIVVSIFVNPTQFDNHKDLETYPRTLEADKQLLKSIGCDLVFAPTVEDIYQKSIRSSKFSFDGLEFEMEGKHRSGHFDGVGTIVKRLFEIIKPNNAYFGEKDFQQLQIIKKLVSKCKIPVHVIGCAIHRENDGLAMSSRNARLTPEQRIAAPFIYNILQEAQRKFRTESASKVSNWVRNEFRKNPDLRLEYFEIANIDTLKSIVRKRKNHSYRGFVAAFAGNIRLIDNIALN